MSTSESFEALRRANPRTKAGFTQAVEAAARAVDAQVPTPAPGVARGRRNRRRLVGVSTAGVSLAAAAAATLFVTIGSPDGGPGVENAAAAVRKAATVTATSAERSGTAVVRITHDGRLWAGSTIRWHGEDVAVSRDAPLRFGRAGLEFLLVDGTMYGRDAEPGWLVLGSPKSIDPGSGTTPEEYLASVREDVGGATLRRITGSMTGLATRPLGDGSTLYSGTVAAGLIARESAAKGGQPIRVLPFGYVAHDEAANPAAPLGAAVTVGADGVVREISVTWGSGDSAWTYNVVYERLGATEAPDAPANPRPLRARAPAAPPS